MPTPSAGAVPGALALADGDEPEEHGTSHFVAIDRWGDAVSYTSTIESGFGSGLVVGGFYLNNELTDFSHRAQRERRCRSPTGSRAASGRAAR